MTQTVQVANALLPKVVHWPANGCQRRINAAGELDVIMTGYGNVLRNVEPPIAKCMYHANGINVIPGKYRSWPTTYQC